MECGNAGRRGEDREKSAEKSRDTAARDVGTPSPGAVTELLRAWSDGDDGALEQLMPLVEAELRRLARATWAANGAATRCRPRRS